MKKSLSLLALVLSLAPAAAMAADKGATPPAAGAKAPRHPLKGVVTGVIADRGALLVKHEEVPGVMRAMTMMFKVDPAALKAFKEGDAITGQMARENNEWWLHDVKAAPAPAPAPKK